METASYGPAHGPGARRFAVVPDRRRLPHRNPNASSTTVGASVRSRLKAASFQDVALKVSGLSMSGARVEHVVLARRWRVSADTMDVTADLPAVLGGRVKSAQSFCSGLPDLGTPPVDFLVCVIVDAAGDQNEGRSIANLFDGMHDLGNAFIRGTASTW